MANKRLTDPNEINDLKQRLLRGEFPLDLAQRFGIGVASVHNWKNRFKEQDPTLVFPDLVGKNRSQFINAQQVQPMSNTLNKQATGSSQQNKQQAIGASNHGQVKTLKYIVDGVQMIVPKSAVVKIDESAKNVLITKEGIQVDF